MTELLIRGGHVIDPAQGLDGVRDVAVRGGRIAAVGLDLPADGAAQVLDARGLLVTPGLIDIHTHIYEGVSHYGINPDATCLATGATTVVDAGSSGAQTFPGLRKYIIEVSQTRVLAYLNLSAMGMLSELAGELEDIRYADTRAALKTLEANRDVLLGIKVRMEPGMCGANGYQVLKLARETSDAAGLPLMIHIGDTFPPLPEILAETRAGDVVTHCYHDRPGGILDEAGRVLPAVRAAAARGVFFDVGHGRGSFAFQVARQALAQDFPPGTISTDLHIHNLHGPVFDLATTMSKFLHLGLTLPQVVDLTTRHPARSIRLENEIGTLRPGACADVTLLRLQEGPVQLTDAADKGRETVTAERALVPAGVVRAGRLIFFRNGHG
ncbi:MAG: amidohydrolase/deacetylase family metallohydrolase [Anaerolineales bacterium]|nr:amidohydrolase/deacetylase family metallohydrolase [Anaerolineales bacterium]